MEKLEIAPGIVVYKNVLDGYDEVVQIVEQYNANGISPWVAAEVRSSDNVEVNKETRDTQIMSVSYMFFRNPDARTTAYGVFNADLSEAFYSAFTPCENDYKSSFGVATVWHDQYSVLKYGKGQKFVNHIDDHQDYHRRISTVFYLNEDYSGGEINFPRFNLTYKPKANELLMFPSTYVYNHSVSEVTDGNRYAVVSWLR